MTLTEGPFRMTYIGWLIGQKNGRCHSINTTKCKVVYLGKSNSQFQYLMNTLTYTRSCCGGEGLGSLYYNDLKPSRQCQQAYAKASKALGLIARTISYKRSDVLLKLYKSLVRLHLEYCVSAWSPYYQKDKHLLERIQHRFTRMIPGMKQLPYEEILGQLGLWSLEERRNRADLLQVFKMFKGLYHSVSSSHSAITLLLEVTQQKSINSEVHWKPDFFPKELIGGTFYIRKTLLFLLHWIPSRTVYSSDEKLRWASSQTSRSAWPIASSVPEIRHRSRCGHTWYVINVTRSQAVARIADRTAKNCKGHVT